MRIEGLSITIYLIGFIHYRLLVSAYFFESVWWVDRAILYPIQPPMYHYAASVPAAAYTTQSYVIPVIPTLRRIS